MYVVGMLRAKWQPLCVLYCVVCHVMFVMPCMFCQLCVHVGIVRVVCMRVCVYVCVRGGMGGVWRVEAKRVRRCSLCAHLRSVPS